MKEWIRCWKKEYSYDTNGNQTLRVRYNWDSGPKEWVGEYKRESSYDANGNLTIRIQYGWDSEINDWKLVEKCFYYYNVVQTAINKKSAQNLLMYPNPAKEFISIQSDKPIENSRFELFNMQGQKVLYKELSTGKNISLKELTPGLYFYTITIDGELQCGKLIKE
jgi:hypothetical protein